MNVALDSSQLRLIDDYLKPTIGQKNCRLSKFVMNPIEYEVTVGIHFENVIDEFVALK